MAEIKKYLDLPGLSIFKEKMNTSMDQKDAATLQSAKDYADSLSDNYDPAGTAQTKVQELASGQVTTNKNAITALEGKVGDTEDLNTSAKSNLVDAINEVRQSVEVGGTGSVVTIETQSTTPGMAKTYTFKQGSSTIGVVDIPKDMVVSSGTVEVDPEDQEPGTYLVLTLANATSDKVYINVGALVDLYTAKASAAQVQIAIDSETREISATIVSGSITATELADSAVTTLKIADGNVTKAKLATAVQSSLDKADTALQKADIVSGTANGTIAVDGTDVAVKGLNSAAYKVAGTASGNVPVNGAALETTVNAPIVTNASGQLIPHASGALKSAAFADISDFDVAGTAQTLVTNLSNGQVTINKNDISTIKGQIADLESETVVAITEEEIEALFA